MKPGGQAKHVTVKLAPESARLALHALGDVLEFLESPEPSVDLQRFGWRVSGQLRLLALLLERSLDKIDQLPPRWPSQSGSIHKIQARKFHR